MPGRAAACWVARSPTVTGLLAYQLPVSRWVGRKRRSGAWVVHAPPSRDLDGDFDALVVELSNPDANLGLSAVLFRDGDIGRDQAAEQHGGDHRGGQAGADDDAEQQVATRGG